MDRQIFFLQLWAIPGNQPTVESWWRVGECEEAKHQAQTVGKGLQLNILFVLTNGVGGWLKFVMGNCKCKFMPIILISENWSTILCNLWEILLVKIAYFNGKFIFFVCSLIREYIRDFFMCCCLSANCTLDRASSNPCTVLFDYNGYAVTAEAVSTRQDCPLWTRRE